MPADERNLSLALNALRVVAMPLAQQLVRPNTSSSRPGTASSLSSLPTMSSMGSSLNGAQLAALVSRRGQLRSQMARVDRQMSQLPPSRGGSSAPPTAPPQSAGPHVAQQPQPVGRAPHPCGDTLARLHSQQRAATASGTTGRAAASQAPHQRLPGALQPGRYAFWPKGLAASRAPPESRREQPRARTASSGMRGVRPVGAEALQGFAPSRALAPFDGSFSKNFPTAAAAAAVGSTFPTQRSFADARRTLTPITIGL